MYTGPTSRLRTRGTLWDVPAVCQRLWTGRGEAILEIVVEAFQTIYDQLAPSNIELGNRWSEVPNRLWRIEMIRRRRERRERASGRTPCRRLPPTPSHWWSVTRCALFFPMGRGVPRLSEATGLLGIPIVSRTVDPGRPLGLYFDVYHLGFDDSDRTRYTIEYTAYRKTDRGALERLFRDADEVKTSARFTHIVPRGERRRFCRSGLTGGRTRPRAARGSCALGSRTR
jgi:hypothetical protein